MIKFNNPIRDFQVRFEPQENITSYEVALCMTFIFSATSFTSLRELWDKTPDNVKRHFKVVEDDE